MLLDDALILDMPPELEFVLFCMGALIFFDLLVNGWW